MDFIFVLISIFIITVLIVVHEFGHFLAAKYYGFQAPVFGIGMPIGPGITLFEKWGTTFKFYWFLIGGFVAIPELGDESNNETLKEYDLKPFREFPVFQRMVVASGGIIFNVLFAFLLAIIMAATVGLPSGVASNEVAALSSSIKTAKKAGIQVHDKILSVNGIKTPTGESLQSYIKNHPKQELLLTIERPLEKNKNEIIELKVFSEGALGIVLDANKVYKHYDFNPITWIIEAFKFTVQTLITMFLSVIALLLALFVKILSMIAPNLQMPNAELGEVKGIVGIVQLISGDIKQNISLVLEFAVLLSLNLAVINVLPIPALDGGHLAFMTYEAIFKQKPSEKLQQTLIQIGFAFLMTIILITTFNDIKNWIMG